MSKYPIAIGIDEGLPYLTTTRKMSMVDIPDDQIIRNMFKPLKLKPYQVVKVKLTKT